jgi:tRNA pseudouridine38-40 synthase
VHATGQVVSFSTLQSFPLERLVVAINALLPPDCSVRAPAEVAADFSARFSARERTYVYAILNREERSALLRRYAYHVPRRIELAAMRAAAARFIGEHDFRAFAASAPLRTGSGESEPSTTRTIHRLAIERVGELIRIEVSAKGFLRHMVRNIVGALLECGTGRRAPEEVGEALAAGERALHAFTAPAHGLYLAGVKYDGYDAFAEPPPFGGPGPARLDGEQAFP